MSRTDRNLINLIGFSLLMLTCIGGFFMIREKQKSLEILESDSVATIEHEQSQEDRIRDLRRRVKALEKEDERLLEHIKWFVMRRSGISELHKMEAAVARLEAAE